MKREKNLDIGVQKRPGIGKTKHYCHICQKQCVDSNGYKLHVESQAHLLREKSYNSHSESSIEESSSAFAATYTNLLESLSTEGPVLASAVYRRLLIQQPHLQLKGTCWTSLVELVSYLEKRSLVTTSQSSHGGTLLEPFRDHVAIESVNRAGLVAKERPHSGQESNQSDGNTCGNVQIPLALASSRVPDTKPIKMSFKKS